MAGVCLSQSSTHRSSSPEGAQKILFESLRLAIGRLCLPHASSVKSGIGPVMKTGELQQLMNLPTYDPHASYVEELWH